MLARHRWLRLVILLSMLGLGLGSAWLVAAAGADSSSTPAVQLHLDTLQNATTSPDKTTPMGTTPDSSGHNLNAVASGTPVPDGRFQGALKMDYSDNGVTVPDNTLLQPSQVTIMAWVRRSAAPGADKLIVGKPVPNNQCGNMTYGLTTGASGGVQFDVTTDHGDLNGGIEETSTPETGAASIWNGQWHAVAGTYDGTTMRLWVDGALAQSTPVGPFPLVYDTSDPGLTDLYAGQAASSGACDESVHQYNGQIDEIRVYDRALSQAELQYLQSPTATAPPNLPVPVSTSSSSSTTSSGPPPPPVASFTAPTGPVPRTHLVILDARGTTGAVKLLWDIGGDGHTDLIRPPSQPVLGLRIPVPTKLPVKLTVIAGNGSSSTVTHTITIAGPAPPQGLVNQIRPAATAVSAASPSYFTGVAKCAASQQTLTFQLAEVIGCFDRTSDLNQVPLLERQVVSDHYDSQVYSSITAIVCRRAAAGEIPQSVCDQAKQILPAQSLDVFVSHHSVKLNGITITPVGPASVVVYPSLQRVISSFAIVRWGGIPVDAGPIDFNLRNQTGYTTGANRDPTKHPFPPFGRAVMLSFDLKNLGEIGGFHPEGSVQLALQTLNGQYSSTGSVNLSLPSEFAAFGGQAPSAGVLLSATNYDGGPIFDHLSLNVPEANLGAVDLTNVNFTYERNGGIDNDHNPGTSCSSQEWKATANVFLIGTSDGPNGQNAGLILTPPPSQNGVEFCAGGFKAAGGQLNFGDAAPQVFPGVFLNEINFAVQLDPTLLRGGATLSAVDLTRISGTLLAVFAHPWPGGSYTLDRADAGADLQDLAGHRFTSTSLAIGGALAVNVPGVGVLNIFHGGAFYSYPDYFGLGAKVNVDLGVFYFTGSLGGQFVPEQGLFELDANAEIQIVGIPALHGGGTLVASEKGAVACLQVGPLNPGFGVYLGQPIPDVWIPDGCKPSKYWSAGRALFGAARAAGTAQAPIRFTIVKGETVKSLKVGGQGGAPHVLVQGPGGQNLTVSGDGAVWRGALEGLSASKYSTTWLGVKNGRPGHYTITPLPGSVPVTSFAETRPGYDTNFKAHVTGHGNHLVLHYDARKRGGGQQVTFFEDGLNVMHPLVTSTGGKGTIRFTPAPGASGSRTIVARATVQSSPIRSQTLAHFHFGGTPRTGAPRRVRVRRRGQRLTVTWSAGAGAARYGVVLRLSNGSTRIFRAGARRSLRISGVALDQGGSVGVSTQGELGDWARPRSASFRRLRAPFTVLQTNRNNERRQLPPLRKHKKPKHKHHH